MYYIVCVYIILFVCVWYAVQSVVTEVGRAALVCCTRMVKLLTSKISKEFEEAYLYDHGVCRYVCCVSLRFRKGLALEKGKVYVH